MDPPPKPTLEYNVAVTKNNIANNIMVIYPNKIVMQVNIALLTVTDTRTIENDKSGEILVKKIRKYDNKIWLLVNKVDDS